MLAIQCSEVREGPLPQFPTDSNGSDPAIRSGRRSLVAAGGRPRGTAVQAAWAWRRDQPGILGVVSEIGA